MPLNDAEYWALRQRAVDAIGVEHLWGAYSRSDLRQIIRDVEGGHRYCEHGYRVLDVHPQCEGIYPKRRDQ